MAIIASISGDNKDFAPAPAGVHQGVCVDVFDMPETKTYWQGVPSIKHCVRVYWLIAELREDGKPFLVTRRYTLGLHEKSALRRDLESWRGKRFTSEELAGFDVETLIGANCLLNITHKEDDGKTFTRVDSIMPLVKGMPKMTVPKDFVRKKDRTDTTPTPEEAEEDAIPF